MSITCHTYKRTNPHTNEGLELVGRVLTDAVVSGPNQRVVEPEMYSSVFSFG